MWRFPTRPIRALCAAVALALVVCGGPGDDAPSGRPGAPLVTRSGAVARADEDLARSLLRLQVYSPEGAQSSLARRQILGPELAEILGRDGRALVAYLLDHTSDIVSSPGSRHARASLFEVLGQLNQRLDERGLGYYLCAGFRWDEGFRRVALVEFEPFAITGTRTYLAHGNPVRALHVQRLGASWLYATKLGFWAPEYPEVFVLPRAIAAQVRDGLLPAADPTADTPLFAMVEDTQSEPYRAFRRQLAHAMRQELGIGTPGMERERAAITARDALSTAVELHEIQHLLDQRRGLSLTGRFDDLANRLGDERLARAAMHETSAHLGQLARDNRSARTILGTLLSNAFTDVCADADCLGTLVLVEELGVELGHVAASLSHGRSYETDQIAALYVAIASHDTIAVAGAARTAWERLFAAPLAEVRAATHD